MSWRQFLGFLSAAVLVSSGNAQPLGRMRRIAIVHFSLNESVSGTGSKPWQAFFSELRRRGYIEGEKLMVDRFAAEPLSHGAPRGIADLLARNPEVIIAELAVWVRQINAMSPAIPIVAMVADPIGEDVSVGLRQPSRNITGVSTDSGPELLGKHLEILLEAAPRCQHVACLGSEATKGAMRALWADARRRGTSVQEILVHTQFGALKSEARYASAFAAALRDGADGVLVFSDPEHSVYAEAISKLSLQHKLPLISPFRSLTEAGGLVSYGADLIELERQRAEYVARILDGTKAGDLPLQQPTKFELVINLKSAKALGLTIPPTLLARADEVIE